MRTGNRAIKMKHGTRRPRRRAFSMIEVLIAISITSVLLTSVLMALDASFHAYQATTESTSRHAVARLTMHRLLAMIRTGSEFGPFPLNVVTDPIIKSDFIEFKTIGDEVVRIEYRPDDEALFLLYDEAGVQVEQLLMNGVTPQFDTNNQRIEPFTLHYEIGPHLFRATVDLQIDADPEIELRLEDGDIPPLRLVGSTMPRNNNFK